MLKVQSAPGQSYSCAIWKMDGANFQSWCCKLWPICNHQPPTQHSGARSHTPVFALNWEKRFVRRNCFNYFPARQEALDRFDGCRKEESLCLSLSSGRDCTKSFRATAASELMFNCEDGDDENTMFEVEYNIDKSLVEKYGTELLWTSLWQSVRRRQWNRPYAELKGLLCCSKEVLCLPKLFPSANFVHATSNLQRCSILPLEF